MSLGRLVRDVSDTRRSGPEPMGEVTKSDSAG